jgi:hypothetical protein
MTTETDSSERAMCKHEDFEAHVDVNRMEDTGRFAADVRVSCARCGEPFRFIGLESGVSHTRPMCSVDGIELRAPIEPEGEKRIHARSVFEVPPEVN